MDYSTEPQFTSPSIGQKAPPFTAVTTEGQVNFPDDYKGKWVIFFSHPADFTPVCTTEFMVLAGMQEELSKLNCELLGLSIDSNNSHIAWLRTIKEKIKFKNMENIEIKFPIIADLSMEIAHKYAMIQPFASETSAVRAVYFIDPKSVIRAIIWYPLSNGRCHSEIKRILMAMQTTDEHNVATPADWQPGDDVIITPPQTREIANQRVENPQENTRPVDWFITFKKIPDDKSGT